MVKRRKKKNENLKDEWKRKVEEDKRERRNRKRKKEWKNEKWKDKSKEI